MSILKIKDSQGNWVGVPTVKGDKGNTGNGISSAILNDDYTLTLTFTDGTTYKTPSIRGEKGEKGEPATDMEIHICSASEYDAETRIPTIANPNDKTFYLVPTEDGTSPDLFTEWVYVNNAWEMFGSMKIDLSGYLTDVQINGESVVQNGIANIDLTGIDQNADDITDLKEGLRNTVDTNILLNSTFVQGGWVSIINYDSPNPTSSTSRIRNEFSLVAKKIQIKVLDSDYAFAYAIFDSNGNGLSSRVVADVTDYTFAHNDIATIRVVLRHTDDSNIAPDESLNIGIIVDDNPISFSGLSDDIKAVANDLQSLNNELNGTNYTNESEWIQGGYGSITSYANPNPNSTRIRIRSEFVTNDGKTLKIHRDKEGYDFVYAVFDSNGNLLAGKMGWQSSAVDLAYDNIHMVRLSVRKSDNSNILISDYEQSGIYIDCEGRLDELEKSNKSSLKLKVMTFNIGRFSYGVSPYYLSADYEEKLANYKRFFAQEKCDVVGLQEQNKYLDGASSGSILANDAIFDYLYPYHSDTDNWTCIKSKYELSDVGTHYFETTSNQRSYSYATLNIDGKSIYLLCVHTTPNAGADQDALRAKEIAEIISLVSDKDYFIVFGDFNAQTTALFDSFINEGYHIANGGYLPFEWTYSYKPADFSTDTPSDSIRYFDNIVTSDNIIVDYSERLNVYADLSSDHIPFIAYLTVN